MKTLAVLIGNSDNKLTQSEWSDFCDQVDIYLAHTAKLMHFNGGTESRSPYQSHAWVFEIEERLIEEMKLVLTLIRTEYKQDSIALLESQTEFL